MSSEVPSFRITQDMEIAQPAKAAAFPVTFREWRSLRQAVSDIEDSNSLFHTLGSALVGAGLSALITVVVTDYSAEQDRQRVVMWSATVLCFACGALALFFAAKEKKLVKRSSAQVVSQMDVIQERFPSGA